MKILLIGNAGTGKSTLARQLHAATRWPVLALDRLWHADDYSVPAKKRFAAAQTEFMAAYHDWIIDGNYGGTLQLRLAQADVVVWLRTPRVVAIGRVLRRSWRFARDPSTRPDMAPGFREHFDADYLAFLRYIWGYERRAKATLLPMLAQRPAQTRLIVCRTQRQKQAVLRQFSSGTPNPG